MSEVGNTTAGFIRRIVHDMDDDTPVEFEYIVASLFPEAYENMQILLKDAHTMGYKQAMDELKCK